MAVAINCRVNLLPEKLHLHKSIKVNKKSYLFCYSVHLHYLYKEFHTTLDDNEETCIFYDARHRSCNNNLM